MNFRTKARLLVVGDSIALGATMVIENKVAERATPAFVDLLGWRRPGWTIEIDAAIHRTTVQALQSLPHLLTCFVPDVVLFIIGGSDADMDWRRFAVSRGRRVQSNTQLHVFQDSLQRLVQMTIIAGARPVLSDLPSHNIVRRATWLGHQTGINLLPWIEAGGGQAESDRRLAEYNVVVDHISAKAGIPVARWANAIAMLPISERFGPDATHPSARAHQVITDVVEQAVGIAATFPEPVTVKWSALS